MRFDFKTHYKGNLAWLEQGTIFLTQHGSRAYGTNRPDSDFDFKGICCPPPEYYHGINKQFEQAEIHGDPDVVIYDLRKFMKLATDCNPNIIEVLFTDPDDWQIKSPLFEQLHENRNLFLSMRAKHSFSGYAVAQLKRARTHRQWLLHPATKEPMRADYGLDPYKANITKDQIGAMADLAEKDLLDMSSLSPNFLAVLEREKAYIQARRHWEQYREWKKSRNPKRSALEDKCGYDSKNAMHLVRLMRMAEEIVTTGQVIVKRPDFEELLEIRNGAWSYDKIVEWADKMDEKLEGIYKTSTIIPHKPDYNKIDALCVELVEKSFSLHS